MPSPDSGSTHRAFLHLTRAFPRTLVATLAAGVMLTAVLTLVVVVTVFAAAPTLVDLIRIVAVEYTLAGQVLWTAALWALLPLAAFVLTGLIYLGSALIFADAALRSGHAGIFRALGLAVRRVGAGLVVVLALLIGLVPLGYLAVRWSFALPEVWLAGASPRVALRASWQSTRGRVASLYGVLGGAYLAVIALAVGVPLLVGMLPWEHGALVAQALCGMLLAPVPVIVLVQRWRAAGGAASGDTLAALRAEQPDAVRPVRGRGAVAGATTLTLVVGLLLPVGAANADPLGDGEGISGGETPVATLGGEEGAGLGGAGAEPTPTPTLSPTPSPAPAPAPAPQPAFAPASALPVVEVTPDVSVVTSVTPPSLGDSVSVFVTADPDGLIPADVVVDGEFEVVDTLDGTVLASGTLSPATRDGATGFLLRAWSLSLVVRAVVETADARYEFESDPVDVEARDDVTLYPTVQLEYETTPPTLGSMVTARVVADPEGWLPPGYALNGPFTLFENSGTAAGGDLAEGTFVDGVGTVQFPITHRSMSIGVGGFFVSAEGHEFWFMSGGGGDTGISVDPVAAQLTVSTPAVIQSGIPVRLFASVELADGSAPAGPVTFDLFVPSLGDTYTFGPVPQEPSGRYAAAVCLQSTAPGDEVCASASLMDFVHDLPADAGEVWVRAHFATHADPDDAWAMGTSDWHTVTFDSDGSTPLLDCRVIDFRNVAAGNSTATPAQTAPLGNPTTPSHVTCESSRWNVAASRWDTVLGHRDGSLVQLQARPAPGLEFVEWRHDGTVIGTSPVMNWTVSGGAHPTQAHQSIEAVYRPICLAPDIRVTGAGAVSSWPLQDLNRVHPELFPDAACQLRGGGVGVYEGTWVRAVLTPTQIAASGERAQLQRLSFSGFQMPTRRTVLTDEQRIDGIAISFEARRGAHWNAVFGPACGEVLGEGITVLSEPNCLTPTGLGFTGGSQVDVAPAAAALGEYDWVGGWRVDGVPLPEYAGAQRAIVTVPRGASVTVAFDIVGCFPVTVTVQEASDGVPGRYTTGSRVTRSPAPNCGVDGDRWLEGSEVTLEAVAGPPPFTGANLEFAAWSDDPNAREFGARRSLIVTEPIELTASFYVAEVCSTVTILGEFSNDDVTFGRTGCGPGRYLDLTKTALHVSNPSFEEFTRDLPVYPTGHFGFEVDSGDFAVFGYADQRIEHRPRGPAPWVWTDITPIECDGNRCAVEARGDVQIELMTCQTLDLTVNIRFDDDASGVVYTPEDFGLGEFEWVTVAHGSNPQGNFRCGAPDQWRTGSHVTFEAQSPAAGFVFESWGEVDNRDGAGVIRKCEGRGSCAPNELSEIPWVSAFTPAVDSRRPETRRTAHRVDVNFSLRCSVPNLDAAIAIVTPAPNCPGASARNPSYVDGTLLQLAASPVNFDGRDFRHFEGSIIEGTVGMTTARAGEFAMVRTARVNWDLTSAVDYPSALAVAGPDTKVWGWYQYPPSDFEKFGDVMANAGKFAVGGAAVAVAALAAACGPCAGAIAVVTLAEVLTRALGAEGVARLFAMLNPTYVLDCITRWGLQSLPPVTTTQAGTWEATRSGAGVAGAGVVRGAKTVWVTKRDLIDKVSERTRYSGAAAGAALALYSAEVYNFDFTQTSAKDLRDTAAFLACLANTYG